MFVEKRHAHLTPTAQREQFLVKGINRSSLAQFDTPCTLNFKCFFLWEGPATKNLVAKLFIKGENIWDSGFCNLKLVIAFLVSIT